ncbi:MAG: hypothetical protein ACRC2U_01980 [Aeromonas sp.]
MGTIVCRNAAGFAVPGADAAGLTVLGIAEDEIDNTTGANGDVTVPVRRRAAFELQNLPAGLITTALLNVPNSAMIADNQTVTTATQATNDIVCGTPIELTTTGTVWVQIG